MLLSEKFKRLCDHYNATTGFKPNHIELFTNCLIVAPKERKSCIATHVKDAVKYTLAKQRERWANAVKELCAKTGSKTNQLWLNIARNSGSQVMSWDIQKGAWRGYSFFMFSNQFKLYHKDGVKC